MIIGISILLSVILKTETDYTLMIDSTLSPEIISV